MDIAKVSPEATECEVSAMKWVPVVDCDLMLLFHPDRMSWDLENVTSEEERLQKLRLLDHYITRFEARIWRSDEGFRAWRELHQAEMNAQRFEAPTFPRLQLTAAIVSGKYLWDDPQWSGRYAWMVNKRTDFAEQRLKSALG